MPLKPGYKLFRVAYEGEVVVAAKDVMQARAYVELDLESNVTDAVPYEPSKALRFFVDLPHEADPDVNPQGLTVGEIVNEDEERNAIASLPSVFSV